MSAPYQTIRYVRQAVQLEVPETPTEMPLQVVVDAIPYEVYRDQNGFYIIVNTKQGQKRASEGQWAVLMSEAVPAVPAIPEVKAVGTVTVGGTAAGDGQVGVSYNGVNYAIVPVTGATADNTAAQLGLKINSGYGIIANVVGAVITLSSQLTGTTGNIPVEDISEDTTQDAEVEGLTGGANHVPSTPEVPAILEIYNDGDFQQIYEPEVI